MKYFLSLVNFKGALHTACRRACAEKKGLTPSPPRRLGMDELPRPEREPGEVKNTVRDYSYVKVEKIDNKE